MRLKKKKKTRPKVRTHAAQLTRLQELHEIWASALQDASWLQREAEIGKL